MNRNNAFQVCYFSPYSLSCYTLIKVIWSYFETAINADVVLVLPERIARTGP